MNYGKVDERLIDELCDVFLKLKSREDCKMLLLDLCTYKEINSMAQRIEAAKLLMQNKTYEQIISQIDISSATLSRVSRCIRYGSGGYLKFLGEGNEEHSGGK